MAAVEQVVRKLVLQHYGVKGMHWGVRKSEASRGARAVGGRLSELREPGKRYVINLLKTQGNIQVNRLANRAATAAVNALIKRTLGIQL